MVTYDARSALVVVDVQNDFADPSGSLCVRGGDALVPRLNEEIRAAREGGAAVLYTQDWHPPSTPHFSKDGGTWPVHCVGGSWGAELHPGLDVAGPIVRKGFNGEDAYSGFAMRDTQSGETRETELEALLRAAGADRVVIAGLATDYCVKATALDGLRLGFEVAVLADAIAPVELEPGDGARAEDEMVRAGAVLARSSTGS